MPVAPGGRATSCPPTRRSSECPSRVDRRCRWACRRPCGDRAPGERAAAGADREARGYGSRRARGPARMAGVSACAAPPTVSRGDRRPAGGAARSQPGYAGHGHGPLPTEGHRGARASASTNGAGPGPRFPWGSAWDACSRAHRWAGGRRLARGSASSARTPIRPPDAGSAGDRLGVVDVLGVLQEVVARLTDPREQLVLRSRELSIASSSAEAPQWTAGAHVPQDPHREPR